MLLEPNTMMDVDSMNPGLGRLTSWCCRKFLNVMAVPPPGVSLSVL